MKNIRNILCSIIATFGLMVAFAMPAQADPIPFDGTADASFCTLCFTTDPFGFGFGTGVVSGIAHWDQNDVNPAMGTFILDVYSSLTFQIGDFFFDGSSSGVLLTFSFGQLVGFNGNIAIGLVELGLNGSSYTASNFFDFGGGFLLADWNVLGSFDLPPEIPDPKVEPVPEPGTLTLLGIGLLGLGASRRRRTLKN